MSKRNIGLTASVIAGGLLISILSGVVFAVPEPGTFVIITVDPDTGERVGNVKVRITQLEADVVTVPPVRAETDDYGVLYHTTHAGLYRIKAPGATSVTYLPSGAYEVYVVLPVNGPGN